MHSSSLDNSVMKELCCFFPNPVISGVSIHHQKLPLKKLNEKNKRECENRKVELSNEGEISNSSALVVYNNEDLHLCMHSMFPKVDIENMKLDQQIKSSGGSNSEKNNNHLSSPSVPW
jgi:hypothetical protein